MKKTQILFVGILCTIFFSACINSEKLNLSPSPNLTEKTDIQITSASQPESSHEPQKLSAWAAYWDTEDVLDEVQELNGDLKSLSFFAVYFNKNNQLFIHEKISALYDETAENDTSIVRYITIVNDKINNDGSSSLKDVDLLHKLLMTDAAADAHVEDLINLALNEGYDGIEIDYEAIRNNLQLWERFIKFINKLYIRTNESGLRMRVLLEPEIPFDMLSFPKGPEYVIMCYNLFGTHSGPGPKANEHFIRNIIEKTTSIPGKKTYAVATGGFDWINEKNASSLTQTQAIYLNEKHHAQVIRDEESMCVKYQYTDGENAVHEVWYADEITLKSWIAAIQSSGDFDVAIWRLGGNNGLGTLIDLNEE